MLARLFVLIGGLLVLALTAALVAPYFIDWTNYRADFEREASNILGRQVTVRGTASARLLPFPSVTFSDVVVGGSGPEPALTVESFSMDAELAPFMSGEFRIFDMRLVRPKAIVSVGPDGAIDWTVRPSTPFEPTQISLEKLTIDEGRVTVRHAAGGREHVLSEIDVSASARSLVGPWRIEGTLRADGQRTALSVSTGTVDETGAMRLRLRANPDLYPVTIETDGSVRLEKGAAAYAGTFRIEGEADVAAELAADEAAAGAAAKTDREPPAGNRLSGTFAFDDKRLAVDEFRFETGPLDDPYVAEGRAFLDLGAEPRFSIVADGAQVRFDGAGEGGEPGKGGQSLEERLAALQDMLADMPKPTIPGSVEVNLPAIVAGDTMIRDIRLSAEPRPDGWSVRSLAAVLPGRATVEANGTLTTAGELGFRGHLLLAVAQPSGFVAWLSRDVDEAIRRLPGAGFSADVELSAERQRFTGLELLLGAARFHGEVDSRRRGDARPSMRVDLDGGALDFDALSAFAALFVSDSGARRFGETDLDIAVEAGPVSAGGLTAERLDTAVRLRQGAVEVDRLSIAGLEGATVSATASLENYPALPAGKIDLSVVAVDLRPLVDAVARRYPNLVPARALAERAAAYDGLLAESEINLVAAITAQDGRQLYALDANGSVGGTAFTGRYSGPFGDPDAEIALDIEGRNADATALLALYGARTLPLGLTGPGETRVSVNGKAGGALAAAFRFTGEAASASFDGEVTAGEQGPAAKGRLALTAADIEPWMMTTGLALPGMGMGTGVELTAEADYANGLLVLSDLRGTVNEGAVAGDVNLDLDDGLPHVAGQLAVDELDLYPFALMILGDEALEGPEGGWAKTPFRQNSAMPFTAEVDLSAGSFSAGPVATVSGAHVALGVDGEGVRVSDMTGALAGGQVSGLFELKNNGGTGLLTAQLKLVNADLGQLAPRLGLGGQGDVSASLSASGKTMEGIVAALSGSGTASLRRLVVPGIDPGAFPALIAEADRIGRDIDAAKTAGFAPAMVGRGRFDAGSVEVAFTVAGGVLRAPPLTLHNAAATLSAEIRGDLADGTVAADGTVTYAAGDEALVGSEPAVGFAVSGQPGDVSASFDTGPLAQFLTQRALEKEQARVEAMQAELLEKQRLRHEVRYYAALQAERDRLEEERRRAEEDVRRKAEEAARIRAEEEAARRKAEEEEAKARSDAAARQEVPDQPAPEAEPQDAPAPLPPDAAPLPGDRLDFDTGPGAFDIEPAQPQKRRFNPLRLLGIGN